MGLLVPGLVAEEEEVVEVVEESSIIPPRLVATAVRRQEPITPLVPIEGLNEKLVRVGRELFQDTGISYPAGAMSCASCHSVPEGGIEPEFPRHAVQVDHYNTPTVINASLNVALHWDAEYETLEEQIDAPISDPERMNTSWERIEKYVNSQRRYRKAFRESTGELPTEDSIREAFTSYLRFLIGSGSKFDQWLAGDERALSTDELSGYLSFRKLNCVSCHQGDLVGGSILQPLGEMKSYFEQRRSLTEDDLGRFNITGDEQDRYVFRVPSLRTAASTAPYFHDGSVSDLSEAVVAMIEAYTDEEPNPEMVRRIELFIRSLEAAPPSFEAKPRIELEEI